MNKEMMKDFFIPTGWKVNISIILTLGLLYIWNKLSPWIFCTCFMAEPGFLDYLKIIIPLIFFYLLYSTISFLLNKKIGGIEQ